jgi:cell division protein ZapA (FtsZ GTPase activity inhibitor)
MTIRALFSLLLFTVFAVPVLVGCGQEETPPAAPADGDSVEPVEEYNPHDVPITDEQKAELRQETAKFADAVAKIQQFRGEIEQETATGIPENPYKAHQALDKADLVLQWLPEIARDSGLAKEHWEAVNTSANDLRTLFEQVHQNIDNKQDPNFAAVADQIDQKIAGLKEIAK